MTTAVRKQLERLPEEYRAPSLRLLDRFIRSPGAEYRFNRLLTLSDAESGEDLAAVLGILAKLDVVVAVVKVVSSDGSGIEEYSSLKHVPKVVHDWRTSVDVPVTTDNIEVVYRVPGGAR